MNRRIFTALLFILVGLNSACQQLNRTWRPTEQAPGIPTISMKVASSEVISVPAKSSRLTLSGNQTWSAAEFTSEEQSRCFLKFPQSAIDRKIQLRAFEISQESVQPFQSIWKEVLADHLFLTPFASRSADDIVAVVEGSKSLVEAKDLLKTKFDLVIKTTPEVRQIFSVSEQDGKKLSVKLICDSKATMSIADLERHLVESKSVLAPVQNF
ncbi:MAG: hypothetical protein K2X47_05060 [Bdellovibrionales bacterium]|nr:hypothetical protein [Bdellovibrionales bacterium]